MCGVRGIPREASPALPGGSFLAAVRSDLSRLRPAERASVLRLALRCVTSPELLAAVIVRAQQALHARGSTTAANALRTLGVVLVGIDVSAGARIGARVLFAHPTGVVIGNGVVIGDDVTIAGGVTLGSRNPGPDFGPEEYPTIGDGVVLSSHAVVLGAVRVGARALVGAHAVVLDDVPAEAVVVGAPARQVASRDAVA